MTLVDVKEKMNKTIEMFISSLTGIRDVINPALLESVRIKCYEQNMPLKHLANIAIKGNRISILPYDQSIIKNIESDLKSQGFNANVFSKSEVVVSVPELTIEETDKIISRINKIAEETRVSIRNIRKKSKSGFKELDETTLKKQEKELDYLCQLSIQKIDEVLATKTKLLKRT